MGLSSPRCKPENSLSHARWSWSAGTWNKGDLTLRREKWGSSDMQNESTFPWGWLEKRWDSAAAGVLAAEVWYEMPASSAVAGASLAAVSGLEAPEPNSQLLPIVPWALQCPLINSFLLNQARGTSVCTKSPEWVTHCISQESPEKQNQ